MKKLVSFLLWFFAGLIILASLGIVALVYTFDISSYKEDIVSRFNGNTGLVLDIKGDLSLTTDEFLYLSIEDITLSDSLGLLAEVKKLDLVVPLVWPNGKMEVRSAVLFSPVYHFRTAGIKPFKNRVSKSDAPGFFNFSPGIDSLVIDSVSVTEGRFILYNRLDSVNLDVRHIATSDANFSMLGFDDILHSFDIEAKAAFKSIMAFGIDAKSGHCQFRMKNGNLFFRTDYMRSQKSVIDLSMDPNPEHVAYHMKGVSRDENIRDLFRNNSEKGNWVKGRYTGNYDLNFILGDTAVDISSLSGMVTLESSESKLYGISLDDMVKTFKKTQQFSFKDLGSVMIFGPWGLALSKGGDYAELAFARKKDSTMLDYLHCRLSLDSGEIEFQDVAFRTTKNRVALMGKIDFLNSRYDNFSYALIDKDGCSVIREEFNGPFEQASSQGINEFAVLMGPVTNLFQSTSSVVLRNDCKKAYTGVVMHPIKQKGFLKRLMSKSR
ncbi:MAG TPA: hypothetical protein DCX54_05650 [Flavobacteriales bacterium]|nr:hypothetical protein [Flavobacteriales bacterium]